jgi:hygromycin-B 7''-O-kinase
MLPIPQSWHEWGRMFTDAALWRPAVQQIYRASGLGVAGEVEAGYPGTCAVFIVDGRAVVKIYPPTLHRDFGREREAYRLLDGRLGRTLPAVLAEGIFQDQIEWPYLILEFRPGQAIREVWPAIPADNRLALAAELGELIRAVHNTPLVDTEHFDPRPVAWQVFVQERQAAALDELRQKAGLPEKVLAEIGELFAQGEPALPAGFQPCLLNADVTEDHLLLVEQNGRWRLSALIDWADAEVGAPAYEWPALWFSACQQEAAVLRHFARAYDPTLILDEAFAREALLYTLLHRFGAEMVAMGWQRLRGDRPVSSLAELQRCLWPFQ